MAFIGNITAINSQKELVNVKAESSSPVFEEDRDFPNDAFKKLIKKSKKWIGKNIKVKKSKEGNDDEETFDIVDLFKSITNIENIKDLFSPAEVIDLIPESAVVNDVFIENLEKINDGNKLSIEDQEKLSEKEIAKKTLEKLTLGKKYEEEHLAQKYLEEAFNPEIKAENIIYLKEYYKASALNEGNEESKMDSNSKLNIPRIENEDTIRFMAENYESIKTPTIRGILKLYLERPILPDSPEKEKELYKDVYLATYRENLSENDSMVGIKFNAFMQCRNMKNILGFTEADIDALEYAKEKNKLQLEKAVTTWLKFYGYEDINKELATTGMNLSDEDTRKKTITLLSVLENISSPEINLLKANITKTMNKQLGLNESFTQGIDELADMALGLKKSESNKQQKMAIDAFKIGIFKGENPKSSELSDSNFYKKLDEQELVVNGLQKT
jgi:hypothetical protein